jgi:hypothetical protein
MIFLTGDVHEIAPQSMDYKRLPDGWTEAAICEAYLEIANKHSICPTLFFTGLAVEKEGELIRSLADRYEFEIGGHNFSVSHHPILLGLSRRFLGLANGPSFLQKRDMSTTIRCILERLGVPVISWRNHAYRMDRNTYRIAAELGVRQVSNRVTGVEGSIREVDGVLDVPINTLPDHESLGHGGHKPVCGSVQEWVDQVLRQVEYQQAHGLPSVILAHPVCMFIEDHLTGLDRLCAAIGAQGAAPLRECSRLYTQPLLMEK